VLWFWTQRLIGHRTVAAGGIGDAVHKLTEPWHRYFACHPTATAAALIVSSLFIDLIGLGLIGSALFGSTFAPFLAVILVFAMRQVCQALCSLPPPPGALWRDPGFPSLLVTYEVSNDFFFSGHTALAVLGFLEAVYLGPAWLGAAVGVVAFGEIIIVLVLRAHYTMDVVAAVFAAFFAADIAAKLAPWVDGWLP
jgi:hypothetical protein